METEGDSSSWQEDNRKCGRDDGSEKEGRAKRTRAERPERMRDAITPLWRKGYAEQLDGKAKKMVNKCSKKIVQEVKRKFTSETLKI